MIYVDDMFKLSIGKLGRMKMSHMIADDHDELIAFAEQIGLRIEHIQHPGTKREHFDVSMSMRKKAISAGAVPIGCRELAMKVKQRVNAE